MEGHTRLHLHLYATNLPRVGLRKSPPDCYALVKFLEGSGSLDKLSETKGTAECTEIIEKSCHPQWTKVFTIDYEMGAKQFFSVHVIRRQPGESEKDASIGGAVFEISDVLSSKQTKTKRLRSGGCVYAHLHPVSHWENQERLFRFQLCALELEVRAKSLTDVFSAAPDTFVELAKRQVSPGGYTWITVYRSSPVLNNASPTWQVSELDLETICNGDLSHPLRLSVWLHKKGSHEVLLGMCETTVQNLLYALNEWENQSEGYPDDKILFIRKPPSRRIKDNRTNQAAGKLGVKKAQIVSADDRYVENDSGRNRIDSMGDVSFDSVLPPPTSHSSVYSTPSRPSRQTPFSTPQSEPPTSPKPTFVEYLDEGCILDVCVALDFTGSNGDPRCPGTLHHRSEDSLNDYEASIKAVVDAVELFNEHKEYTVWGFGAKFGDSVRNIFQCGASPVAVGVDGVLEAYRSIFRSDLLMSGPAKLVNVIQAAAVRARKLRETMAYKKQYCMLLIVTNGGVRDIHESQRKLSVYSDMPLSVVIIGVGESDFTDLHAMNQLVSPRRNLTVLELCNYQQDPSLIGTAAVQEVQRQVIDYMSRNRIYPGGYG